MPVCRKVESPMTATTWRFSASGTTLTTPVALPMLAPMQTQVSIAESGGMKPRV